MGDYVDVMEADDLRNGSMRAVSVQGKSILLARVDDAFYATDNVCPHMKGELAKGTLNGTVVTCPRHASQFDLRDGHVVHWTDWSGAKLALSKLFRPPTGLKTYPVKTEEDRVLVEI